MSKILGISAFYHDSAATVLIDGEIIAAAQEERFTRKKHDSDYPFHAVEFVLKYSNIKFKDLDQIVFFEKPFLKFERLLETYVAFAPRGFNQFLKVRKKYWLLPIIIILVLFGGLIILTQGSAVAPFIYTIF